MTHPFPPIRSSLSSGKEDAETGTSTKTQASFRVVLFNDESHTYDYVVELLTQCCELSKDAAFRCAVEVDVSGRTIVYYGTNQACNDVCAKILSYGADHRLPHSTGSMQAEVQGLN
ncbi:MAG: ATP-dependent Clp protease adaptor ClpS [Fibrobacteria bacterium]|nr:ATP-dependent Clp protease adaptor ClpS [Fibrobacteria bacterium]